MGSLKMRLEYNLVDANQVHPGIHKVRIRLATSSEVDTTSINIPTIYLDQRIILL